MNTAQPILTAAQVMHRDVVAFVPGQEVADAVKTLLRHRVSCGPVVDQGKLVGMFGESDALKALAACAYESEPTGTVSQHMRRTFDAVRPDTDLFTLAKKFETIVVRRVSVVDQDGRLLGLVLREDVIEALARLAEERAARRTEPKTAYERVAEHLAGN
jgi:CBS domain-containing protein